MKNNVSVIIGLFLEHIFFFPHKIEDIFSLHAELGQQGQRTYVEMTVCYLQTKVLRGTGVSICFLERLPLRSYWSKEDVESMQQMILTCQVQLNFAEAQPTAG